MIQDRVIECIYCGSNRNIEREHIIPISYVSVKRHYSGKTAPACHECNATKSDKVFHSIPEVASYLAEKYRDKYRNLLLAQDEELNNLLDLSDIFILERVHDLKEKQNLKRRLDYLDAVANGMLTGYEEEIDIDDDVRNDKE